MKKIGLIVNPIAGMGGSVGLKGTDGESYQRALKMGAQPITPKRVKELLSHIENREILFMLVAPGKMGADIIKGMGLKFEIVDKIGEDTTAEDTKRIARHMLNKGIDILIFCG
ncbi:MAG: ATP-NAD kinase, partial [Candidatus Thorarchaeota archaeon]